MFEIKDFGNNIKLDDPKEVIEVLSTQYVGKSVSIVIDKKSGIKHTLYVDVSNQGALTDSYTDKDISSDSLLVSVE